MVQTVDFQKKNLETNMKQYTLMLRGEYRSVCQATLIAVHPVTMEQCSTFLQNMPCDCGFDCRCPEAAEQQPFDNQWPHPVAQLETGR